MTLSSFQPKILDAPVGIAKIEPRARASATSRRVCFCMPGRGGTERDQAIGLYADRDLGAVLTEPRAVPLTLVFIDGGGVLLAPASRRRGSHAHADRRSRAATGRARRGVRVLARTRRRHGLVDGRLWGVTRRGTLPRTLLGRLRREPRPMAIGDRPGRRGSGCVRRRARLRHTRRVRACRSFRRDKVRIDCGTGDPFYNADTAFVAALVADGQHPDATFDIGCHNAPFWQSGISKNLRTCNGYFYEQPLVAPQESHFSQEPLRTMVI